MPQINLNWAYGQKEWTDIYKLNVGRPWSGNNNFSIPEYMQKTILEPVAAAMRAHAPIDTGLLVGSIWTWRGDYFSGGILGAVGTGNRYARAVNAGSHPHMPPLLYLPGWALRHWPGLSSSTVVIAGQHLQKYIATYGTKAQPFIEAAISVAHGIEPPWGTPLIVTYQK